MSDSGEREFKAFGDRGRAMVPQADNTGEACGEEFEVEVRVSFVAIFAR